MNRLQLTCGAALLALCVSAQAAAQSGAGATGGRASSSAGNTPAPPPAPPAATSAFSAQRYLNGGDYVGAVTSHQVVTSSAGRYREFTYEATQSGSVNRSQAALNASGPINSFLSGDQDAFFNSRTAVQGTVSQVIDAAQYYPSGARVEFPNVNLPRQGGAARPTSQLEDAQTAALRNSRDAVFARYAEADRLYRAAINTGNQSLQREAFQQYEAAGQLVQDLDRTIFASDVYRGRAFTTETDAASYLTLRDHVAGMIYASSSTRDTSQRDLADRIRDAHSDGTSRDISAAQRQELAASMARTRAADEISDQALLEPFYGFDLTPEGRAAARQRYNQRVDLVPTADQVENAYLPPEERQTGSNARQTARAAAGNGETRPTGTVSARNSGPTGTGSGSGSGQPSSPTRTAANEPPAQPRLPGGPDYPTARARTPEERAADAAQRMQRAEAQRVEEAYRSTQDVLRRQQAAAVAAAREAARLANERDRIARAAEARVNRDANWNAMVAGRFDSNRMWEEFRRNGGTLTTLELEAIYRGYDLQRGTAIPPAMSLSSAPNSLSSVGRSLSAAGTPVRSGTDDYNDPAVQSLYEALYGLTQRRRGPLGPTEAEIETANFGDYDLYSDPDGRWGRESGGYIAASLFSEELDYLSRSFVNGRNGLQGLLAQPFNVLLTWGDGAFDLDLHMTGPTGAGQTERFHIYYAAAGNLQGFPFAALIRDCVCRSGSEVVLTSNLLAGGVYRVSVFNFGDQSANSNNLSNQSNARIQIVRGGVAVPQGNGTTIQGGRLILDTVVPVGQSGNTWVAVELDPRNGRITVPRSIRQSEGSANVR